MTKHHDDYSFVQKIITSQNHRGPDNQTIIQIYHNDYSLYIGHNRLSIIDLSLDANQPMWDADKRYCIVYNGEIYNYVELRSDLKQLGHHFRTQSDTEVILESFKQWGIAAVNRFNGMFAFALFDVENQDLWLVRDRFGKKPLFYYQTDDSHIVFASTPTTIAQYYGLTPNLEYVHRGLVYWYYEDRSDISPYKSVKALPSGNYLHLTINLTNGRLETSCQCYYNLINQVKLLQEKLNELPEENLIAMFQSMISDAVAIRLRSDVPIGVSLSGGLDSSTVAALAAERHPSIIGFTFGDPANLKTEGPLVSHLRQNIDITPIFVYPTPDEFVARFWETLEHQDSPFPGCSIIAQNIVYQTARSHGVKVLLGGQGGDEAFMGYRKFQLFYLRYLQDQHKYLKAGLTSIYLLRNMITDVSRLRDYWFAYKRYSKHPSLGLMMQLPEINSPQFNYQVRQPLALRQLEDITDFSLPVLLRYEDRNSMGHSIESRLPFMDYRIIEFGLAIPERLKIRRGYGKWIIRKAMTGRIPDTICWARYKRGFDVQQAYWIKNGLGHSIRTHLERHRTEVHYWFNSGQSVGELFSDSQLIHLPHRFAEAVSALWLIRKL